MVTETAHGGGCCGMHHISGFYNISQRDLEAAFPVQNNWAGPPPEDVERLDHDARREHGCIAKECILNQEQYEVEHVRRFFDSHPNIRHTASWVNANTGRRLYQFVYGRLYPQPQDPVRVEVPAPEPQRCWRLYRLRFTEEGVVDDENCERIREWIHQPRADYVSRAIQRYKGNRRMERVRFQLRQETIE